MKAVTTHAQRKSPNSFLFLSRIAAGFLTLLLILVFCSGAVAWQYGVGVTENQTFPASDYVTNGIIASTSASNKILGSLSDRRADGSNVSMISSSGVTGSCTVTAAGENTVDVSKYNLRFGFNKGASQTEPSIMWASNDDFLAGVLTINYKLENRGTNDVSEVRVSSASATEGVTIETNPLPDLGPLPAGATSAFSLKWHVPASVGSFKTGLSSCAD